MSAQFWKLLYRPIGFALITIVFTLPGVNIFQHRQLMQAKIRTIREEPLAGGEPSASEEPSASKESSTNKWSP